MLFVDTYKPHSRHVFLSLESDRERLLRESAASGGAFTIEPYVEPRPQYVTERRVCELTKEDLPSFAQEDVRDFAAFVNTGLIDPEIELYQHQIKMLSTALERKKAVITSGTGSGKTEAFLMPLMAYLVKESRQWGAARPTHGHANDWWRPENQAWRDAELRARRSPRISQRAHESRPAGLRAMIIYPMNALVEDQMTRLRKALDSDAIRTWLDQNRKGNRFYFGRFNSNTPVSGYERDHNGRLDKAGTSKSLPTICTK